MKGSFAARLSSGDVTQGVSVPNVVPSRMNFCVTGFEPVLTAMTAMWVASRYASISTPPVGLSVAAMRWNPGRTNWSSSPARSRA